MAFRLIETHVFLPQRKFIVDNGTLVATRGCRGVRAWLLLIVDIE